MMDELNMDLGTSIDNKLDRTKWKKWKFADLVDNIVEKVKPQESGLEHYIGLEHLDSGSLHIKRFGESKTLIGDKLKIYKNDIIFAKRNAYLKRVSIAPFDAVASAHSMVLRPKSENVLPEFLPFFLLSEKFWQRAIEISVGSLSPTINWRALAKQEFLLPPKDQQGKLAELLWAMDEVIEREFEILKKLEVKKNTIFNELHKLRYNSFQFLEDLCLKISSGGTPSRQKEDVYFGGDIPWVKTKELNDWIVSETEEHITQVGLKNSSAKLYPKDTILLAMYGVTVGKIGLIDKEMTCNQACCALIADSSKIDNWFLFYYLTALRKRLIALSVGSAQPNISSGIIKRLKIPDLKIEHQKSITTKLLNIDKSMNTVNSKISSSKALQKSLINQVF